MAKIGTYPAAAALTGSEELISVQSAASVKLTANDLRGYIYNTVYKNSGYTALTGDVIFANSQSGIFTINLPTTPATGDYVGIWDAGGASETNNITVASNGNTINGVVEDYVLDVNGSRWDFLFDGTTWRSSSVVAGVAGGLPPVFVTTTYNAAAGEMVMCDSTGGAFTVTLPASPDSTNRIMVVDAKGAASAFPITVARNGQTINGLTENFIIDQNWGQCNFAYNGSDWRIAPIGFPEIITSNTVFIVYKAANYTAQAGERVMVASDVAAYTITLPASPATGDSVGVWDAGGNAAVNNIAVARNGSTIMGVAADDSLNVSNGHFEYVFSGTTWKRSFWAPGGLSQSSGTFTPVLWDASNSSGEGQTYAIQSGYYRLTGDIVNVWIDIQLSSIGTLTGGDGAKIGGLPFLAHASAFGAGTVGYATSLAITAGNAVHCYVGANSQLIILTKFSATTGTSPLTITEVTAGGRLILSASYLKA